MKDTRAFLRDFNQAWEREDTAAILAAVSDDIRFRMATEDGVKGKQAFAEWLEGMTGGGGSCQLDMGQVLVDGDSAMANGELRVSDGNGSESRYAFCDVYKLRDGKISDITVYFMERKTEEG